MYFLASAKYLGVFGIFARSGLLHRLLDWRQITWGLIWSVLQLSGAEPHHLEVVLQLSGLELQRTAALANWLAAPKSIIRRAWKWATRGKKLSSVLVITPRQIPYEPPSLINKLNHICRKLKLTPRDKNCFSGKAILKEKGLCIREHLGFGSIVWASKGNMGICRVLANNFWHSKRKKNTIVKIACWRILWVGARWMCRISPLGGNMRLCRRSTLCNVC